MKNAAEYVKKFKKLLATLKKEPAPKPRPEISDEDPIEQLLISLLARAASEHRAAAGLAALRTAAVDLNELRVTPVAEMVEVLGADYPQARAAAESVSRALNAVFNKTHTLSLAHIKPMGVKGAAGYLSGLDGVDAHARAAVVMRCLKGRAVPLDDNMLSYLRRTGVVPPEISTDEVQAFIERQIKPSEDEWFYQVFKRYASTHAGRPEKGATKPAAAAASTPPAAPPTAAKPAATPVKPAATAKPAAPVKPTGTPSKGEARPPERKESAKPAAKPLDGDSKSKPAGPKTRQSDAGRKSARSSAERKR